MLVRYAGYDPDDEKKQPVPKPIPEFCKYGHPLNETTIGYFTRKKDGFQCRVCKTCRNAREKHRRDTDPDFRKRGQDWARNRYWVRKAKKNGLGQVSGREQHPLCDTGTKHQEG